MVVTGPASTHLIRAAEELARGLAAQASRPAMRAHGAALLCEHAADASEEELGRRARALVQVRAVLELARERAYRPPARLHIQPRVGARTE